MFLAIFFDGAYSDRAYSDQERAYSDQFELIRPTNELIRPCFKPASLFGPFASLFGQPFGQPFELIRTQKSSLFGPVELIRHLFELIRKSLRAYSAQWSEYALSGGLNTLFREELGI